MSNDAAIAADRIAQHLEAAKRNMHETQKQFRKSPTAAAWNDAARAMFMYQQLKTLRAHNIKPVANALYGQPNYLLPDLIGAAIFGADWPRLKPDFL